ncbi:MAG: glycosyl transferase family 1 [Rubritepida sp.]|nr:glycosyl transferase family 1 [Rubritepida sp.]
MRVCLLSLDILGPIRNGGIGTAFTSLAETLAEAGHEVTLLYPANHTETTPLSHWVEHYAARGIRLECLYTTGDEKRLALAAYHWLKRRDFDAIHFHEWRGIGHFLVVARRCGLAFRQTALVCQLHSPSAWHREYSNRFTASLAELEVAHMERCSAEGADLVISPSRYMLDWVRAQGWVLRGRQQVQPNLLPRGFTSLPTAPRAVEELVFFGRLEERKGVALFCQAVSAMIAAGTSPARITFLGKLGDVAGEAALAFIARAAQGWGLDWDIRNDLDVLGARDFLAGPGRIAVIASVMENSPYTVLECLVAGIPFLAPDCGGVAELVAPEDRAGVLYPREASVLAERMAQALRTDAPRARLAFGLVENNAAWLALHRMPMAEPRGPASTQTPLVSICMASFNRPLLLAEAIASIEAQSYPNIELVLVDDASTEPAARAYLDSLEPRFAARGWQLLRHSDNRYLGAARNTAVAAAHGEFLLFMDDDNLARPGEVEVFVRAALASGADILTCQLHFFAARSLGPAAIPEMPNHWIPLGGPVALGFFENAFGDANFFIRRAAFEQLGGFTPDRAAFEDWEFLMRAALAGQTIECLPETLFGYRVGRQAMLRSLSPADAHRAHRRVARAWAGDSTPPEMREALAMALDMGIAPRYPAPSDGPAMNGADAFRGAAGEALARGEFGTARNLLTQALRLQPQDPELQIDLIGLGGGDPATLGTIEAALLPAARRAVRRLRASGDTARAEALEILLAASELMP